MAVIGNVSEYRIITTNTFNEQTNSKIWGNLNPEITYNQIDSISRAIIALSRDTYEDTILVTNVSVNEVLAEE